MAETLQDSNVYRRIKAILETRRANAAYALEEKRRHVFALCPELEDLEQAQNQVGVAHNRSVLDGALSVDEARARIAAEGEALRAKQSSLLNALGFPAEYLTATAECPLCGDTGYGTNAQGLPERCVCFRQLLLDSLEAESNILSAGTASFELFDETLFSAHADEKKYGHPISPRENILRIRDSALRFVRAFKDGHNENLYFFGRSGTGKTFIAAAIAHALMREGVTVLYRSAPALFNIITEYRMRAVRDDEYRDAVYRYILDAELLILDDLGTESMTNARYSEFISLLNERLADGGRTGAKSTILSTNMDLPALRKLYYDERILSRIVGAFKIIPFFGDDLRLNRSASRAPV